MTSDHPQQRPASHHESPSPLIHPALRHAATIPPCAFNPPLRPASLRDGLPFQSVTLPLHAVNRAEAGVPCLAAAFSTIDTICSALHQASSCLYNYWALATAGLPMVALSKHSHRVAPNRPLGSRRSRNCRVKTSGSCTRATSMSLQGRIKLSFKSSSPATSPTAASCSAAAGAGAGAVVAPPLVEAAVPQALGSGVEDPASPAANAPPKLKLRIFCSQSPTIKPLSRDGSPAIMPLSRDGSCSDVSSPRLKSITPRKGSYDIDDFIMPLGWGSPRFQVEEDIKPKEISIPSARRPAWLPCIPQASVGGKRYRGSSVHQDLAVPRPDESSGEEVPTHTQHASHFSHFCTFAQDISDEAFTQRHSRLEFMEHNHRLTVASKKKKKEEESEQPPESPTKASLLSCSFNSATRCSSPSPSESGTPRSSRRVAASSTAR